AHVGRADPLLRDLEHPRREIRGNDEVRHGGERLGEEAGAAAELDQLSEVPFPGGTLHRHGARATAELQVDYPVVVARDLRPEFALRLGPYAHTVLPRNARHSLSGVAGMSTSGAPAGSASVIAFMIAASAPVVPASPTPFTPMGLVVHRTG